MTPTLAAFRAFIPPRYWRDHANRLRTGDRRDQCTVFIVRDRPHYISQSEDDVTAQLRGSLTRAAIEETT